MTVLAAVLIRYPEKLTTIWLVGFIVMKTGRPFSVTPSIG